MSKEWIACQKLGEACDGCKDCIFKVVVYTDHYRKETIIYPRGKWISCVRGDTCKGCDRCIKCFQETVFHPLKECSDSEEEPLLSSDDEESSLFDYQQL